MDRSDAAGSLSGDTARTVSLRSWDLIFPYTMNWLLIMQHPVERFRSFNFAVFVINPLATKNLLPQESRFNWQMFRVEKTLRASLSEIIDTRYWHQKFAFGLIDGDGLNGLNLQGVVIAIELKG